MMMFDVDSSITSICAVIGNLPGVSSQNSQSVVYKIHVSIVSSFHRNNICVQSSPPLLTNSDH
jgi:hypothetical protein